MADDDAKDSTSGPLDGPPDRIQGDHAAIFVMIAGATPNVSTSLKTPLESESFISKMRESSMPSPSASTH